jgi:hypothetical protein
MTLFNNRRWRSSSLELRSGETLPQKYFFVVREAD